MQPKRFITVSTKILPILGQINAHHMVETHRIRYVSELSSYLKISMQSGMIPSHFPIKMLCTSTIHPIPTTCSKYHILLGRITPIIFSRVCYHAEVLLSIKEQRNILHEISKLMANWIGHILHTNCLLQQVIEGNIKRGI
jgi:hypothetical protein